MLGQPSSNSLAKYWQFPRVLIPPNKFGTMHRILACPTKQGYKAQIKKWENVSLPLRDGFVGSFFGRGGDF